MNLEQKFKIVCPFCRAAFTAKMEDDLMACSDCDTCGGYIQGTIDIICSNCNKLVYRKEF